MYESFGAVVDGDAVEFRLFVLDARQYERGGPARIAEVRVVGDFQDRPWDLASAPAVPPVEHPAGRLFTHRVPGLAEGFYEYKYLVGFENGTRRWCTDPCTRYVGRANENAGFVIGGHRLDVRPLADPRPREELVIYELMLDDFTHAFRGERAPVDAVLDRLDHVLAVGVNTVQLMPWTAWRGGAFSWGYDPFLFFAVEDRYIADPTQPSDRLVRFQAARRHPARARNGGDHGRRLQPRERRRHAGQRLPVPLALAGSGGLAVHRRVLARSGSSSGGRSAQSRRTRRRTPRPARRWPRSSAPSTPTRWVASARGSRPVTWPTRSSARRSSRRTSSASGAGGTGLTTR